AEAGSQGTLCLAQGSSEHGHFRDLHPWPHSGHDSGAGALPLCELSLSRRKDDILVGAPLYMERRSDRKLYEVGRVYLYLQLGRPYSNPWQKLTGTDVYGRFGTAIAPLGDLDQDGYMDVAVGAPFAGKGGSGRVFIYSGHSEGLQTPASQVLDSPFSGRASFGFSVRGATDIDANGYPDMLVGAFGAGKVAVYRAQPVVMAETQLSMPDMLNPEEKTSNWGAVCFWVPLSTGNCDYPMLPLAPELNANLQLDRMKQKSGKRIFLLKPQESTLTLKLSKEGPPFCHSFSAYLRDEADFKDKLSPIVVSINLTLAIPLDTEDLGLVLYGDTLVQKQTRIVLDCGEDNVCIPDLRLSAYTHLDYLLIGAENMVHIKVDAANEGEGAFEAELQVQLPPSAHYQRAISNIQGMEKLICNPKKKNETHVVICELGNPMKTGTKVWGISAACQTVPISFSCCLCLRQAAKALKWHVPWPGQDWMIIHCPSDNLQEPWAADWSLQFSVMVPWASAHVLATFPAHPSTHTTETVPALGQNLSMGVQQCLWVHPVSSYGVCGICALGYSHRGRVLVYLLSGSEVLHGNTETCGLCSLGHGAWYIHALPSLYRSLWI
uniref:Integrin subunit alpha 2b n=1 Tax=Crocodylus porosus TaxID=8502 RepID=A0A7M4DW87_CROPO